MNTQQFTVRRRFAKVAFAAVLITLFACLGIVVFGDASTASNLREAGIIIAPIVACLTTIIAHYSHLVSQADNLNAGKT